MAPAPALAAEPISSTYSGLSHCLAALSMLHLRASTAAKYSIAAVTVVG